MKPEAVVTELSDSDLETVTGGDELSDFVEAFYRYQRQQLEMMNADPFGLG